MDDPDVELPHADPVEVVALIVSPGHNYWFHGRPEDGVGPHPTSYPASVRVEAGRGVVGDRFHGRAGRLKSAMTLVAAEALEAVTAELGLAAALDPRLTRRTVVLRAADLNALRHQRFTLEQGGVRLGFDAGGECSPCPWMDAVLAPGARDAMRGRGGLRVMPLTDAVLEVGPAVLRSPVPLDPRRAGSRVGRSAPLP
ncbi:molybdenum cofactor biosysynthesis protein [Thalassiella azotivora]